MTKKKIRIPTVIFTATPDTVEYKPNYIGIFKKGDKGASYTDLLNYFQEIFATGLTRIMGGRGKIEEVLGHVFNENLMPKKYRKKWIEYGKADSAQTEKALLRHAVEHMLQLLVDDNDIYFPEEVYLVSSLSKEFKTGCIIKQKDNEKMFVLMTPACDLIIRSNGERNTDRVLIVEIDEHSLLFPDHLYSHPNKSQENDLKNAYKNKTSYYHWLPQTDVFGGGFINFRKLFSVSFDELEDKFDNTMVKISPAFVKDIISRFSLYYARQGQPEIDNNQFFYPSVIKNVEVMS